MWKWLGHGFLAGVPMRDISDAEAKERGIVALLTECPDYEHRDDEEPVRPAARAEKAAGVVAEKEG